MCMHMQRNLTLKVNEELVEKAHRYGINISKFLEYALDEALKNGFENHVQKQENTVSRRRDSDPRPCAYQAHALLG